ncbi:MAG: response regulator [Treponema sp.]|jgi:two-component system response regulator YesN|nr:response regulator [Treponema sp.]
MSSLLVCDDEKWIREGIAGAIDWASLGIDTILTARDGLGAVEMVREKKPDIVITDIKMPNFSGLEMIEAVRETVDPRRIIVISGFSDFEYARTALKLGVSDYLLKPVNEDALREAVEKCLDAVREDESILRRFRSAGLDRLTLWLKHIDAQPPDRDILLSGFGIDTEETPFVRAGICRRPDCSSREFSPETMMTGAVEGSRTRYLLFQPSATEYACLFFKARQGAHDAPRASALMSGVFRGNLPEMTEAASFTGEGGWTRFEDGWLSYNQAETALLYNLVYAKQHTFIYDELCGRREKPLAADFRSVKPVVLLANRRFAGYRAWVEEIFGIINGGAEQINPRDLIAFFSSLVSGIGRVWELEDGELRVIRDEIETAWRQEDLHKKLVLLPERLPPERQVGVKRNFLQALDYIEKHYSRPLTMAGTARALRLNASYFSKMFGECAGESFLKYLTRRRMEKAKVLLRESSEKIYEISEKVGYADYRVFSKNFREYAGICPAGFRNRVV